jgi:hypothetical protein
MALPRTLTPWSLTPEMIGDAPIKEATRPIAVEAWVYFGDIWPQKVSAAAVAWNDRAVLVRWNDVLGAERQVWVWSAAVKREPDDPRDRVPVAYRPGR